MRLAVGTGQEGKPSALVRTRQRNPAQSSKSSHALSMRESNHLISLRDIGNDPLRK